MRPYIVLVTGGRAYADAIAVWAVLDLLHWRRPITHLMHGGATGADALGDTWARDRGVQPVRCDALWRKFGPPAGPRRNVRMGQLRPQLVVAFPGGTGTANMVEVAHHLGLEVREVLAEALDS